VLANRRVYLVAAKKAKHKIRANRTTKRFKKVEVDPGGVCDIFFFLLGLTLV